MKTVEVCFDYASPFSYIASEILPRFAERAGFALSWTPINLLELGNYAQGPPYSPLKRQYVVLDATRSAEYHGVPIAIPKPFPVNSLAALKLAAATRSDPKFPDLHRVLSRAAWHQQLDLSSRAVLADCVAAVDGPVETWLAKGERPEAAKEVASLTARSEAAGVFGVPSMLLDAELFWGLDSLPVLEWRLANPKPSHAPSNG